MADLYEARFVWPRTDAKKVVLTGTFDNWAQSVELARTASGFEATVPLPWAATVLFKFVVDGRWLTSAEHATQRDGAWNVNNVLHTPAKPATGTVASPVGLGLGAVPGAAALRPSVDIPVPAVATSVIQAISDTVQHGVASVAGAVESMAGAVDSAQAVADRVVEKGVTSTVADTSAAVIPSKAQVQDVVAGTAHAAETVGELLAQAVVVESPKVPAAEPSAAAARAPASPGVSMPIVSLGHPIENGALETTVVPGASTDSATDEAHTHAPVNLAESRKSSSAVLPPISPPPAAETVAAVMATAQATAEHAVASAQTALAQAADTSKIKAAETTGAVQEVIFQAPDLSPPAQPAADAAPKVASPPPAITLPVLSLGHPIENGTPTGATSPEHTHTPVNFAESRKNSSAVVSPPLDAPPAPAAEAAPVPESVPADPEPTPAPIVEPTPAAEPVVADEPVVSAEPVVADEPVALVAEPAEPVPATESVAPVPAAPSPPVTTPPAVSMPILPLGHPIENGNGVLETTVVPGASTGSGADEPHTHSPINLADSRKNSEAVSPTLEKTPSPTTPAQASSPTETPTNGKTTPPVASAAPVSSPPPATPAKNGAGAYFPAAKEPDTPGSIRSNSSSRFGTATGSVRKKRESIFGKVKDIFKTDKHHDEAQDKPAEEKKMRRFSSFRGKP